jgi:hypothetical protein
MKTASYPRRSILITRSSAYFPRSSPGVTNTASASRRGTSSRSALVCSVKSDNDALFQNWRQQLNPIINHIAREPDNGGTLT